MPADLYGKSKKQSGSSHSCTTINQHAHCAGFYIVVRQLDDLFVITPVFWLTAPTRAEVYVDRKVHVSCRDDSHKVAACVTLQSDDAVHTEISGS